MNIYELTIALPLLPRNNALLLRNRNSPNRDSTARYGFRTMFESIGLHEGLAPTGFLVVSITFDEEKSDVSFSLHAILWSDMLLNFEAKNGNSTSKKLYYITYALVFLHGLAE